MLGKTVLGVLIAAFVGLAGCTGQFDIEQTEPIQVQVEGQPETLRVSESDEEPQRASIETRDLEEVDLEVKVTPVSSGPVTILIVIQGPDNETLVEREITVGEDDFAPPGNETSDDNETSDGNETSDDNETSDGNMSDNETSEPSDGEQVVVQNINVDVRGKDNIVVVADSVEGDATVDLAAHDASGQGSIGNTTQDDNNTTVTSRD